MFRRMSFAQRHLAPMLIVLAACLAALGVFAFARPKYHPLYESKMIDFSKQHYYSPSTVRWASRPTVSSSTRATPRPSA